MQGLSIARSLRLALVDLTLILAVIAALGVASLYSSRQGYENTLVNSSQLASAAANLATAAVVVETVAHDVHGTPTPAQRRTALAYQSAQRRALTLAQAAGDPASLALIHRQINASGANQALAVAALVQGRQTQRQLQARAAAHSKSRRALILIVAAGVVALLGALALVALVIRSMRRPLDELVAATQAMAAGDLRRRVKPAGPTELRHLSEAFNAMGEHLEAATAKLEAEHAQLARLDRAKSEFIATASHELRSPLTSIKGFIELLDNAPGEMSVRQREFVSIILRSTDRLVELVNDLLDVARLDADYVEIRRRPVDAGELAHELAELMGPGVAAKHQQLSVEVAPNLPPALADPGRLRQIVQNLLTNAHLYTPEGGRLLIAADCRNEQIRISVADTGPGMTKEQLQHVYERFYRAREDHSSPGSGLGLAIVKSLVDLHGGKIEVASEVGRGTTFRVSIPMAGSLAGFTPALESLRGRHVLIVEDEREIAALIADQLAPFDVTTTIAADGRQALELLRGGEQHFDAVTMDVKMPEMSGVQLLSEIRADPRLAETPVVFVSAFANMDELSGEWIVSKPIDAGELRDVLGTAVSQGRSDVLVVARERLRPQLEPALADVGVAYEWVTSGVAAARACSERRFEVALIDVGLSNPQAVLGALNLRGRRMRRAVVLFSDGAGQDGAGSQDAARLGLEVVGLSAVARSLRDALDPASATGAPEADGEQAGAAR